MSCPLLEKLAPETRNLIYEYVLTFDTELKHAQKMQPFINKLCKGTASEKESSTSSAASGEVDDSGHRVDTSILTTSKLIYNEAIKIFYENNVIRFDSESCKAEDIVSPLATDFNFLGIATKSFPAIFPSLRACELYAYTDSTPCPAAILFSTANSLQSKLSNEAITFDSVGSFVVTFRKFPQMKLFVQYKAAMERWTAKNHSISDLLTVSEKDLTARIIQLVAVHHPQARTLEDMLIEQYRHVVLPATYTAIAKDSPEYWTLVDAVLCIAQKTG